MFLALIGLTVALANLWLLVMLAPFISSSAAALLLARRPISNASSVTDTAAIVARATATLANGMLRDEVRTEW